MTPLLIADAHSKCSGRVLDGFVGQVVGTTRGVRLSPLIFLAVIAASGGAGSLLRTRLCREFPANREIYREFARLAATRFGLNGTEVSEGGRFYAKLARKDVK